MSRNPEPHPSREMVSLALSGMAPVLGVLLLGWDTRAAMFILSCEVILMSATLAWLFNYPERSTLRGVLFAVVLAPTGFLMWVGLAESYPGPRKTVAVVSELFPVTWIAVALIVVHAVIACRNAMAEARVRGARIEVNDRILLRWIFSVFVPFLAFVFVMAGWKSLGPAALAVVLAVKTAVDVAFLRHEQRRSGTATSDSEH